MEKIGVWLKKLWEMFCANIKELFVVNEKISIKILWFWITLSFLLSVLFYSLVNFKILKMEISLTAFIALTGALPTVYLWIVKERKKEKDQEIALLNLEKKEKDQKITLSSLNKKDIELYQNKIAELNKVYVDAISQFYKSESFMAGAYALNALVDDWLVLAKEQQAESEEHLIRVSQIASILFSKRSEVSDNILFNQLIEKLFLKITRVNADNKTISFNWEGFSFKFLNFIRANLSETNLFGIDLTGSILTYANLNDVNLREAHLTDISLRETKLNKADLRGADLTRAHLTHANLKEAHLNASILYKAHLEYVDLTYAVFNGADLTLAHLNGAGLSHALLMHTNLTGANLIDANLTDADFYSSNLTNVDFTDANLTNADVNHAIFSDTVISNNFILKVSNITLKQLKGCLINSNNLKNNEPINEIIIEKIHSEMQNDDMYIPKKILKKYFN